MDFFCCYDYDHTLDEIDWLCRHWATDATEHGIAARRWILVHAQLGRERPCLSRTVIIVIPPQSSLAHVAGLKKLVRPWLISEGFEFG